MKWLLLTVLAILLWPTVFAYNILALSPADGLGEKIRLQPYIEALLNRGHSIHHITSKSLTDDIHLENYTETVFQGFELRPGDADEIESYKFQSYSTFFPIIELELWTKYPSNFALGQNTVKKLIHLDYGYHFDLVIYQECSQESWLMFAHRFNAPIVIIATSVTQDYFESKMGLMGPHGVVSHGQLEYNYIQSTWEGLFSIAYTWTDEYIRENHLETQNMIAQQHFSSLKDLPLLEDIIRENVSLILTYSHRALSHPRPSLPNMINIGGAHLRKPKRLPDDIQKFMDDATHGVIYVSFGTILKSEKMPMGKLSMFLDAFKNVRQRVLWKYKGNVSLSNVMTREWFPQNDVLAHPNIVLFISQGGTYSNYESVAHGVPMLMIPFNHNHYRNALRAEAAGYAEYILYRTLTTDQIQSKLMRMLVITDAYMKKIKDLALIMNDNIVPPMDEAIYWIEYACEFKGVNHLKTHARYMSWTTYLLVDVFLTSFILFTNSIFFLYVCYSLCCKRSPRRYQYSRFDPNDPYNKKSR